MKPLRLTQREVDAVWSAMLNIADDSEDAYPDPQDRAAFRRALKKVREVGGYKLKV